MITIPLSIHRSSHIYRIIIGSHILNTFSQHVEISKYSHIAVISDKHVTNYVTQLKKSINQTVIEIIITPGEQAKSIHTVEYIWKQLHENSFDRKSLVINLGGGVIGDMGGFAAATYMRGVDFLQIPTTLLAMVDASVGGKLGVDFEGYKNLIGSFAQPIGVLIDVETLATLPDRQFIAGFAEIIKHGLIADKNYFDLVTSKKPRYFSQDELIGIIEGSCRIKAKVVEHDEQESGLRKILNFGHTVGHAIESLSLKDSRPFAARRGGDPDPGTAGSRRAGGVSHSSLLHGEAIAIGMVAEAKLSQLSGFMNGQEFNQIKIALSNAGLPTAYKTSSLDAVRDYMNRDKKNHNGIIKWTLLKKLGEATFDQEVAANIVETAVQTIFL